MAPKYRHMQRTILGDFGGQLEWDRRGCLSIRVEDRAEARIEMGGGEMRPPPLSGANAEIACNG